VINENKKKKLSFSFLLLFYFDHSKKERGKKDCFYSFPFFMKKKPKKEI